MALKKSTSKNSEEYEILIRKRGENDYASYCPQLNYMIKGEEHQKVKKEMKSYIDAYIKKIISMELSGEEFQEQDANASIDTDLIQDTNGKHDLKLDSIKENEKKNNEMFDLFDMSDVILDTKLMEKVNKASDDLPDTPEDDFNFPNIDLNDEIYNLDDITNDNG